MAPSSRRSQPTPSTDPCRLREWRTTRGWSLQIAAELTGYNRSTLSRLERGQTPSLRPAARVDLARRLGARVGELFPVERP